MLKTNTIAPDFTLPNKAGNPVSLSDFRSTHVVLAFYPKDNSPVCSRQLGEYQSQYAAFKEHNAVIIGISADSIDSHLAFSNDCGLDFPLLADPEKSVCKAYGALNTFGIVKRLTYVIGPDGVIRHIIKKLSLFYVSADELLKLL